MARVEYRSQAITKGERDMLQRFGAFVLTPHYSRLRSRSRRPAHAPRHIARRGFDALYPQVRYHRALPRELEEKLFEGSLCYRTRYPIEAVPTSLPRALCRRRRSASALKSGEEIS